MIHGDFETYSELDLRAVGAFKYAEHHSTEVLMLGWAIDDGPVRLWLPHMPFPQALIDAVANGDIFTAHNAGFEYVIWNIVLTRMLIEHTSIPKLLYSQLDCTAGRAAMCGLPRALEKVGDALDLNTKKDKNGKALLKFFSQPRKPTKNNPDTRNLPKHYPEKFTELCDYCKTDVRTERELGDSIPHFDVFDRMMFRLDGKVNRRGIPLDIAIIRKASRIVTELEHRVRERVKELTGGIAPTQRDKLLHWLEDNGCYIGDLQAPTIKNLLLHPNNGLSPEVCEVLYRRIEASKVSTKKLIRMLHVACKDGRARGTLMFYGAHTGRESGRLIQPHNFIRGLIDKLQQIALMEQVFTLLDKTDADFIDCFFDNPITSIAMCMRGFISAGKGKTLYIVDYAQIEARVLVWLAGQDDVLQQFREGLDVYKALASLLWNIPVAEVTSEQRRIAKNLVLGCGFGLGWKQFIVYCAKQDLYIEEEMSKRAVNGYRERNPKVKEYWYDVENCAIAAVQKPGRNVRLRNVRFVCDKDKRFLRIILPSGRCLYYPSPEVREIVRVIKFKRNGKDVEIKKHQLQLMFRTEIKGMWLRTSTYGGRLVENIVQAVAADIMFCGGMKAEEAGYPLVLTVHDEWLAEVAVEETLRKNFVQTDVDEWVSKDIEMKSVKDLERVVCDLPAWAQGCPVTAEGFQTDRYRKN